jgi:hypothetical protein
MLLNSCHNALDSWVFLASWLSSYWQLLILWIFLCIALIIIAFVWILWGFDLTEDWVRLLAKPRVALAAIFPSLIAVARDFEKTTSIPLRVGTVSALLAAVAALQLYVEESNNRDRVKTKDEALERTREATERAERAESLLFDLINETREATARTERAENLIIDSINEAREGRREANALLRRIADGITAAAAAAEEAQEENE